MAKNLSHEEIAQRFIDAKVFDFGAAGRLIAEMGPMLAVSDLGWHGINFGRFNAHACFMPAFDVAQIIGNLRGAGLTSAALEAETQANITR